MNTSEISKLEDNFRSSNLCVEERRRSISPIRHIRCSERDPILPKGFVKRFLDNPFQCSHFIKFFFSTNSGEHTCHFCLKDIWCLFGWCTICNIKIDIECLQSPPPLTIFQPKHHKHSLTVLPRLVTFTCNACGLEGDRNPYICNECNLMVHKDCIDLPRVININRHDHRISHIVPLGQGAVRDHWKCGVCRRKVSWAYGAFKCSRCPRYAVHSKCATRKEVWDGVELEDVPDKDEEIEDPFEVIHKRGDIIHFSHDDNHILILDENRYTNMRCGGCVLPINGDQHYRCVECEFVLHKACAGLPRKKRHFLHNQKLTLQVDNKVAFKCTACGVLSNGFSYVSIEGDRKVVFDVRCSSVSEPFQHDLHPEHPLYWTLEGLKECKACLVKTENPLRCIEPDCDYALCMKCATLPRKVKNRCDDHFLTLRQGVGNASGDVWCDICERKTDLSVRYYTCEECGVALHIDCVLGGFYYVKVGPFEDALGYEAFANNSVTRPLCSGCGSRCKFPFLLRNITDNIVVCDINCGKSGVYS